MIKSLLPFLSLLHSPVISAAECSRPTPLLFIAIESSPDQQSIRQVARKTWLKWKDSTSPSVQYRFFTTETVDSRWEAAQFNDLVLLTSELPREGNEISLNEPSMLHEDVKRKNSLRKPSKSSRTGLEESGHPQIREKKTTVSTQKNRKDRIGPALEGSRNGPRTHPKLCIADFKRLCKDIEPGKGRIDACMFSNRHRLSKECFFDLSEFERLTKGNATRDWRSSNSLKKTGIRNSLHGNAYS